MALASVTLLGTFALGLAMPDLQPVEISATASAQEMEKATLVSATPTSGSTVNELKTINLVLSGGDPDVGIGEASKSYIEVKDADGTLVTNGKIRNYPTGYQLRLTSAITTAGTYTITIKPGAMVVYDKNMTPYPELTNDEYVLTYTVAPMDKVAFVSATPASGSTINELYNIPVVMSGGIEEVGLWSDNSLIEVTNEAGESVCTAKFRNNTTGYSLRMSEHIQTAGTYTITVKKNALMGLDYKMQQVYGTGNDEFSLTYTVAPMDKVAFVSATPASGSTINELYNIPVVMSGGIEEVGLWSDNSLIEVTNEAGESVCTAKFRNNTTGYSLRMSEHIQTAGTYTITVKKNALMGLDYKMQQVYGTGNDEFTLTYTVAPMDKVAFVSATPESGSVLTKLYNINVELSGGDPEVGIQSVSEELIKVTDAEGNVVTNGKLRNNPTGYSIRTSEEVTTPGTYTITVERNALMAYNKEMKPVYGTGNDEFTLTYKVVESPAITFVSATPADGDKVAELETVTTVWEGGDATTGFAVKETEKTVSVTDAQGNVVTEGALVREDEAYVIKLDEKITADGTYTLTIAEGTLQALDAEGNPVVGNLNEEVKLTYTVDSTLGIALNEADGLAVRVLSNGDILTSGFENPVITVADMNGAILMSVAAESVKAELTTGMYIVNVTGTNGSKAVKAIIR